MLGTAGTKSWTTHTNVAKRSTRLTSTAWTGAGLGAGVAFNRRSRADEIFVGIAVRGPRRGRPPEDTLRQAPTHPISHTVLNRAKRQGIAAIEARNSANPPAVFSRPRACNRVSRFSVRTRSRANPESQSAPQTTRLRPRTTPIERRLRPRAPSKRGNKSQSCHSAPASWHDTRPRVKKFGTKKFELESVMRRRLVT